MNRKMTLDMFRALVFGVLWCLVLAACAEPCDPPPVSVDTSDGSSVVTAIDGSYEVSSNMHAILIEHVTSVGGDLIFQAGGNSKHTPKLEGVITFPNLKHVGGFLTIRGNHDITRLEFPALESIGEGTGPAAPVDGGGFHLDNNDGLTHLSMPLLQRVASTMNIDENDNMLSFELPKLVFIGDYLDVLNNPKLATCLAEALVAQVQAGEGIGGPATVTGNNDACSCAVESNGVVADCSQ